MTAFYATALLLGVAVSSMWVSAVSVLLAIVPAAIFASLTNDLADLAGDLEASKRNAVAGRSRSTIAALLAVTIAVGVLFAWLWRDDPTLLACYLATWLLLSLYSLPPFRFKERGAAGVLFDAAGEQLFPVLVAVLLACRGAQLAVSGAWIGSVCVWSFAYGLRGILWHQLADADNDRAANFSTFARQHPRAAAVLGTFVIFPLEIAGLAAMLWQIGSGWPAACLVLYLLYAIRSAHRWQKTPVIVVPKPRFFIVLQQFYTDLFPVGLLVAAAIRDRTDLAVLLVHLLLFPGRVVQAIRWLSASIARTVVSASEPHHGGVG